MTRKLFIVEDHKDMQAMYRMILRRRSDIEIVGQVETAERALAVLPETECDLIIIDVSLPGMDGIALARETRRQYPFLKILIATGHDPEAYYNEAMSAGADDYLVKGEAKEVLAKILQLLSLSVNGSPEAV